MGKRKERAKKGKAASAEEAGKGKGKAMVSALSSEIGHEVDERYAFNRKAGGGRRNKKMQLGPIEDDNRLKNRRDYGEEEEEKGMYLVSINISLTLTTRFFLNLRTTIDMTQLRLTLHWTPGTY